MTEPKRAAVIIMSILFLLLLFSCSSAPELKPGESVEKRNQAAEYAGYGLKYFYQAQYDQALDFFFLSLKQNVLIDNERGIVESYNSIGKTYLASGNNNSARVFFRKAQAIALELKEPDLLIRCLNNTGELLLTENEYEKALDNFNKAYNTMANPEKNADTGIILHNIGTTYKRMGNYSAAKENLLSALKLNNSNRNFRELASDNYALASVYSKEKDYTKALEYIKNALSLDKMMENSPQIARDLYAEGIIQKKAGNLEKAYYILKRSALILESLSLPDKLIQCLIHLEDLAASLGDKEGLRVWKSTRTLLEKKRDSKSEK